MIENLQNWAASFPEVIQWLAVGLISAIPFVESYFGSAVGVLIGLPPIVAIAAAVIGNIVSMLVVVLSAHGVRTRVTAGRAAAAGSADAARAASPRRARLQRAFDRYGVAGVSLLGQTILPSQITSAAMVSFGAKRDLVILWQIISITLWGVAFGVLASLGVSFLG